MSDRFVELETALDRVIWSARAHLAAVNAADGAPDDDAVWQAYVALNNASHEYDELLEDVYGEVTPWDLEAITGEDDEVPATLISSPDGPAGHDPHPHVISVRQRRDYRVPSVTALVRLAAYYGDRFKIECPTGSGKEMTLFEVARELAERLIRTFTRSASGRRPVYGGSEKFQSDPHWRDHVLFYEYFHGENGAGIGASHQTGWTGGIARMIQVNGYLTEELLMAPELRERAMKIAHR